MRVCVECDVEYDPRSPQKRAVGGLISHCPECSEETVAKHAGVTAGDGKQAGVQVLAFESPQAREGFLSYWKAATGLYTGKQCQMGRGQPNSPKMEFRKVTEHGVGMNHKGKS